MGEATAWSRRLRRGKLQDLACVKLHGGGYSVELQAKEFEIARFSLRKASWGEVTAWSCRLRRGKLQDLACGKLHVGRLQRGVAG